MRKVALLTLASCVVVVTLAGCERGRSLGAGDMGVQTSALGLRQGTLGADQVPVLRTALRIASLPDRGELVDFKAGAVARSGMADVYPVQISEAYARRAARDGGMVIQDPAGGFIRLKYEHQMAHPGGTWTWVGRPEGGQPGTEAVITFGEKAVFGNIPDGHGRLLQLTTAAGQTAMVVSDLHSVGPEIGQASDSLLAPVHAAVANSAVGKKAAAAGGLSVSAQASGAQAVYPVGTGGMATVDLVIGYTSDFATRLGGGSQALTRLNFMVDVANQALASSLVPGQIRLAKAVQVNYTETTSNRAALLDLSGVQCTTAASGSMHLPDQQVNCTPAPVSSGLQPLLDAREAAHGDVAVLVREYKSTEQQSCGVAWVLGGGQSTLDASSAPFAMAVVSDSSGMQFPDPRNGATCRDETLVHELGHTMGLVHDQASAAGSDNVLDPGEYGRFPYSFGYITDSAHGNFYTIMALRQAGQTGLRLFSNVNLTCNGFPCGVTGQNEEARSLQQTMQIVASFRTSIANGNWLQGDFDGDSKADLLWHNFGSGANTIWRQADYTAYQQLPAVNDQFWQVQAIGDFNGDGKADVLWRNTSTGANTIWYSANYATYKQLPAVTDENWQVVGSGDFDGDGKADLLWRNSSTGANTIWFSANSATYRQLPAVSDQAWQVVAIADFNGDKKADILWRNSVSGANTIWYSADYSNYRQLTAVTDQNWQVAGAGDFDGDGKADLLWRNSTTGANTIWRGADDANYALLPAVADQAWQVSAVGDFNGDGKMDVLWRNFTTGANTIWYSSNYATYLQLAPVNDQTWQLAGTRS